MILFLLVSTDEHEMKNEKKKENSLLTKQKEIEIASKVFLTSII